jgi:hypothetical protein
MENIKTEVRGSGRFKMKKFCLFILTAVLLLTFTGCSSVKVVKVDEEQVRQYADEMAESILTGIKEDSYEKYSRDFNEIMKKGIPEKSFNESNKMIKDKIGNYESKTFSKAEKIIDKNAEYITVYYNAKFTKEPKDVIVKVVFVETDGKINVAGLWMDSPNLRK